jgi:hypothetical protein
MKSLSNVARLDWQHLRVLLWIVFMLAPVLGHPVRTAADSCPTDTDEITTDRPDVTNSSLVVLNDVALVVVVRRLDQFDEELFSRPARLASHVTVPSRSVASARFLYTYRSARLAATHAASGAESAARPANNEKFELNITLLQRHASLFRAPSE